MKNIAFFGVLVWMLMGPHQVMATESTNREVKDLLKKIGISGDLRLRHDTQWRNEKDGTEKYKRNRERFRFRAGLKLKPADDLEIGTRFATGSGYQNTTNQSFDGHGRGKGIFLDRAYALWTPHDLIQIVGGKFKNPLLTSSLVWDPDVNPEGVAELFTFKVTEGARLFGVLGMWFIEELKIKESDSDPTLFTAQLGAQIAPAKKVKIKLAGTYYNFYNLNTLEWDDGMLDDTAEFLGYNNKYGQQMFFDANGKLLNKFECMEGVIKLDCKLLPVPISIFSSYVVNLASDLSDLTNKAVDPGDSDPVDLFAYGNDDRDMGWQAGLSLGKKKKKGDWHLKYFYQVLEDYAFPAVFVDSDFHGGGTNNKGHYAQGKYFLTDNVILAATGFITQRDAESKDGQKDEDRIQVDLIFKF